MHKIGSKQLHTLDNLVRVAQWIARLPPKQKVAGSNPASDDSFCMCEEVTVGADAAGGSGQYPRASPGEYRGVARG